MRFDIITIFPGMFGSVFEESLIKKAREADILDIQINDLRNFTLDKHRKVDDYPFGGGVGMILTPGPIVRTLEAVKPKNPDARTILLSPSGSQFNQKKAWELSREKGLILICGRYEGVDQRIADHFVDEELSIGDYVVSGGEVPAMAIIDAVSRLLPGVIGDEKAVEVESFETGILEYPQYTRPRDFRGHGVPEELLSGNHAKIQKWQRVQAVKKTERVRPDLLEKKENQNE
tara:strand:- start:456 stop:1151 length:696 start_codon:yes stop_codon:yes gene_type:complete